MRNPIIEVDNISKLYRIGANKEPYLSLRDELARTARRMASSVSRIVRRTHVQSSEREVDFWALSNVSFSVLKGEAIGIIGRNGAGKSTLLKILSQISPPTKGRVVIRGRVASLLEVGTGFHPELTGRENIFLNGAILGMRRTEIKAQFNEIVSFSGVEKFLDTPVKRYSSGMYVRLAFAVAAHLEPEILVVDEVLAVGDAEFQKKCFAKMSHVASGGRTVLFVSHNMGAIRRLCTRSVLLHGGVVEFVGETDAAVARYTEADMSSTGEVGRFERNITRDTPARSNWVQTVELRDIQGRLSTEYTFDGYIRITMVLDGDSAREGTSVSWILSDAQGANLAWSNSVLTSGFGLPRGAMRASCVIRRLPLAIGTYTLSFSSGLVNSGEPKDMWRDAARFSVTECDPFRTRNPHHGIPLGAVVIDHEWEGPS